MPTLPSNRKVRVLVVDDSILARTMISKGLSTSPQIEVVATAFNAKDAMAKVEQFKPDVITSDVEMPGMSGIDFLKQLLPIHPIPVILVSSLDLRVFDALSAGAVDFVRKPEPGKNDAFIHALIGKVITAKGAHVRPRPGIATPPAAPKAGGLVRPAPVGGMPGTPPLLGNRPILDNVIIALGASTGGTEATLEVMKRLPADIPGMLIVQHMPVGFTQMYADRLNRLCQMEVREAKNGDEIHRGEGQRPPALGGRHVSVRGGAGQVQDRGHHHDRHGPGRRRRPSPDAQGGGLHHRPGQGVLRGLRHAHGGLQHRRCPDPGLLRGYRRHPAAPPAKAVMKNRGLRPLAPYISWKAKGGNRKVPAFSVCQKSPPPGGGWHGESRDGGEFCGEKLYKNTVLLPQSPPAAVPAPSKREPTTACFSANRTGGNLRIPALFPPLEKPGHIPRLVLIEWDKGW